MRSAATPAVPAVCAGPAVAVVAASGADRVRSVAGPAARAASAGSVARPGRLAGAVSALPRGGPDAVRGVTAAVLPRAFGERVVSGGTGAHALGVAPSRARGAADRARTLSRWPPLPRTGRK
ncbi:hypothetical protein TNCT6_49260 [Streptomyces sp. 6-11-2]|nr:hypothetical protein TNCT6_49260 [Streptomyces sp. 6-11-2]